MSIFKPRSKTQSLLLLPRRRSVSAPNKAAGAPRAGNRNYLFGIGAAFVALVAVGYLLLNDHPSVANATAISAEPDKSVVLTPLPVTASDDSSINNSAINNSAINDGEVTTQHTDNLPATEQSGDYSPDVELISSYENQIQKLLLENDTLQESLESAMEETDYLREETLHLNEELLRLELALWKANEAAKGPVEVKTVYNITNVRPGRFLQNERSNTESIQSASTPTVKSSEINSAKQSNYKTNDDQANKTTFDLLGASGELEIEVRYEDASPADQLAYDEYINDLGYHISYTEFRFSDKYRPADTN